jgi:hypothetical protein
MLTPEKSAGEPKMGERALLFVAIGRLLISTTWAHPGIAVDASQYL